MFAFLEVVHGKYSGQSVILGPGDVVRVGKFAKADHYLPEDPFLSAVHFSVTLTETGLLLFDTGSENGTLVNGVRAQYAQLADGDRVVAGISEWKVTLESDASSASPHELVTPIERVARAMSEAPGHLYCLLDVAGHSERMEYVTLCPGRHQCLYDGQLAEDLASAAPYLVEPNSERARLALLRRTWGRSAALFLASSNGFDDVRRHLRKFLLVTDAAGTQMFFRYFDPRILPAFVGVSTREERARFFGPIEAFFVEGNAPNVLLRISSAEAARTDLRTEDERVFRGLAEYLRRAEPAAAEAR